MGPSNALSHAVDWLEQRRLLNLFFIAAYFLFIFFMHDPVVHLSIIVMQWFTLPVYNKVVLIIFILFVILFGVFLTGQLKDYPSNRKLKIAYLVATLGFIIIHFRTMFEMNIEIIHIYEYPLLAFLLFPLTRRFGASVLFTVPFMLLDEWHQYKVLYPGFVQYLELNDVMIDIYGCGLAMVMLMICNVSGQAIEKPLYRRSEFIGLCVMLLGFFIALKTCFFCLYPENACSNTYMVLDTLKNPELFWRQYPGRDVIYHVSTPIEAVCEISALCLFYFGLDSFSAKKTG